MSGWILKTTHLWCACLTSVAFVSFCSWAGRVTGGSAIPSYPVKLVMAASQDLAASWCCRRGTLILSPALQMTQVLRTVHGGVATISLGGWQAKMDILSPGVCSFLWTVKLQAHSGKDK